MVIEKVHGLQATSMTMDQRFTLLAAAAPDRVIRQKRRGTSPFLNQKFNNGNRDLIDLIARQLGYHQQKQNLWHGMGMRQQGLRRYGSESSLPGLRRSNSFGNLTQQSVRSRLTWRPNNNGNFRNRSRSVSVSSAPGGRGRRPRRRNAQRPPFTNRRGRRQANGVGGGRVLRRGTAGARGGARGGRGNRGNRGGVTRLQTPKKLPTREELDAQLDQYMAGTKAALDKELEEYMKDAMDMEVVV